MTTTLPKGLAEFAGTLDDLEHAPELLKRLLDLPECGLHRAVEQFEMAMRRVEEAEAKATAARSEARRIAYGIWNRAVDGWSIEELQEATGYGDE